MHCLSEIAFRPSSSHFTARRSRTPQSDRRTARGRGFAQYACISSGEDTPGTRRKPPRRPARVRFAPATGTRRVP